MTILAGSGRLLGISAGTVARTSEARIGQEFACCGIAGGAASSPALQREERPTTSKVQLGRPLSTTESDTSKK